MREEEVADPKRSCKLGSNNITAGMAKWNGRKWKQNCIKEQKGRLKEKKPTIKQGPASKRSRPWRMRNQKVAYVIRIQGWAAECAEEPLDHGKRSEQVLDICRSQACVRPKLHQPIPSQYRRW